MIRHISIFKLLDESQKERMKEYLKEAGEQSSLVRHTEIGENITHLLQGKGPVFGDLVQMLDFSSEKDCTAWPTSKEHLDLIKKTPSLQLICAIDYVIE